MSVTDTPAFRRWFGKSKVVGKGQQPLVVYHGTVGDFTAFDPTRSGSKAKTGAPHGSFFFSDRADVAASYTVEWSGDFSERHYEGGTVLPVYLRIEKPLKVNAKGETWRDIEFKGEIVTTNDLATYAQRHGYDGVIVSNVIDKGRGRVEKAKATVYIALNPTQIKSATGNRGTFDPADPDIRHNPATARRTDPALWERIVAEVTASDKGGRPGQWSARKAQLAVALYQKRGGGYVGPKTPDNALAKWTREQWRTRSGRPSLVTGE